VDAAVQLSSDTDYILRIVILTSGILLVPIGIAFLVLLFKLMFLLHSLSDFLKVIRYELTPVIQELRQVAENLGGLAGSTSEGFHKMARTVRLAGPYLKRLGEKLGHAGTQLSDRLFSH
jgi:hypothetical protein